MTTTSDDGPPPFTHAQARTIRRIGRRCGYPRNDLEDLVQIVWIEMKGSWARVPRVEPDMSKYVFRMARNIAIDEMKKRRNDATTGAVRMGTMDEETATAPVNLTLSARVLAHQLVDRARSRDPQAAGWMMRTKMHGESFPEVSEDEGIPADTIRKRVSRLMEWLQEHATIVTLVVFAVLLVSISLLRAKPKSRPSTARSTAPQNLTPKQTAVLKRDAAFGACDAADWGRCGALLDEALALDPAGENDARVQKARADITRATTPAPQRPQSPPASLKPPR